MRLTFPQAPLVGAFFIAILTGVEHKHEANQKLVQIVLANPNKYTYSNLEELTGLSYDTISSALRRANLKHLINKEKVGVKSSKQKVVANREYIAPAPNTLNVGIVGDVHVPYDHKEYLEFCVEQFKRWEVTHVIFTGDVVDFYAFSRFDHDPDHLSPGDELNKTKDKIQVWRDAFPIADVCIGNHDMRIAKRAFEAGIPRRLLAPLQDMLDVPGWNFREKFIYDGIRYIHGTGGSALARAKKDWMSTVQGHLHPEAFVQWIQGERSRIFAMQVGCGVDTDSIAFDYAKDHRRPAIGVGIILNHGTLPFNVLMK